MIGHWNITRQKRSLDFPHFVVSAREAELRRLRKANVEFEEQNAVLQRHIKDMYTAKERLEAELGLDEKRTQALQQHLLAIKQTLITSLSSVPLPGQLSMWNVWQMQVGFVMCESHLLCFIAMFIFVLHYFSSQLFKVKQ